MDDNQYYRVIAPFPLLVRDGVEPAQVYIGTSQAMQQLWRSQMAQPGDEIHLLVGGNFIVRDGRADEFDFETHRASDVMLHPAPRPRRRELPADKVQAIVQSEAHRPGHYRNSAR